MADLVQNGEIRWRVGAAEKQIEEIRDTLNCIRDDWIAFRAQLKLLAPLAMLACSVIGSILVLIIKAVFHL